MKKKKVSVFLFLLLLATLAGCGNRTPSGFVLQDFFSPTGTSSNTYGWIGHVELVDLAERITVTKSYTISRVQLSMYNVGNPNQDIVVGIYSHDETNDQPGALLGGWSVPANNQSFPHAAPGNAVTFTGLNVPVTPGTYWIVIRAVSGTGDNDANYSIVYGTDLTKRGECHNNSGWTEFMNAQVVFSLYSERS